MDPKLLSRARAGDGQAMENLLLSLAPSIHRFGLRMCGHPADAEEVVQDTLIAVARNLDGFEGRSSLTSWVFALARSACSRRRRGLKNQPSLPEQALVEHSDTGATPEEAASEKQLADKVSAALDRLPEDYREVILLRDVEGLTTPEAAASLAISVDALKSRLHRARAALRNALSPVLEAGLPRPGPACPDVVELWSKKLEGQLSPEDCATMERHLLECRTCNTACDALRRSLSACQQLSSPEVPPQIREQIRAALML